MAEKKEKFDFAVGGQAVMEGVMMRSPNHIVIAVRKPDGEILIKEKKFKSFGARLKVSKIPIVRGMVGLVESMYIGIGALNFSNDVFLSSETKKPDHELVSDTGRTIREVAIGAVSLVVGLALALFLFKWLPLFIADFLSGVYPVLNDTYIYFNIIDGLLKTVFFFLYLILIAQLPEIKRLFQYHGAEHKSIATYEAEDDLTPKEAIKHTRFHPRCGTSFIIIVFALSIFIYTIVPTHDMFALKFLERIAMLPLIAGVSYEALKYSAKHMDKWIVRQMIKPGLWFQKITTAEPDTAQLEVGLISLKRAIELERG